MSTGESLWSGRQLRSSGEESVFPELLELLKTDYDDLHGMGMEALMQFFDEYLAKELKK